MRRLVTRNRPMVILRNEGGAAESFALAGADSGGMPSPPCSWLSHFGQTDAKPGEHDGEWLPRRRPGFGLAGIVGHGRRRRWAAVTRYPSGWQAEPDRVLI